MRVQKNQFFFGLGLTRAGQVYPDISNLIQISNLFNVTVDYLVKDQTCIVNCFADSHPDLEKISRVSS